MLARSLRLLTAVALVLGVTATAAAAANVHWNKAVRIEPAKDGGLTAVSCPSAAFCAAVDNGGNVVTTTRPTGGNGSWSAAVHVDANALTGISCATATLCVAVDSAGQVVWSKQPGGGAKAWSKPARIDSATAGDGTSVGLAAVDCPSASLCVAVDGANAGNVLATTSPTGGAHGWRSTAVGGVLTSISCPSSTLCVAGGTEHYYSTSPAGGGWHATGPQTGGGVFSAIDCPSASLCLGVGFGNTSTGLASTATDPKGDVTTWKTVGVESSPPDPGTGVLDAVGCFSASFCVTVDTVDNAWASNGPNGGVWNGGFAIRPSPNVDSSAISCTSAFCVVVDSAGVETTGLKR